MHNIYYDTEKFPGLAKIAELDESGLSYEYNMLLVFEHSGRVFYTSDSGCYYPTPFELDRFNGPDSNTLTEITKGDSFLSFQREVEDFPVEQSEREEVINLVKKLLK